MASIYYDENGVLVKKVVSAKEGIIKSTEERISSDQEKLDSVKKQMINDINNTKKK